MLQSDSSGGRAVYVLNQRKERKKERKKTFTL